MTMHNLKFYTKPKLSIIVSIRELLAENAC